jgi:hypothetical protein
MAEARRVRSYLPTLRARRDAAEAEMFALEKLIEDEKRAMQDLCDEADEIARRLRDDPMKTCARCKEEKDRSEFGKDSQTRDGLKSWCRACRAGYRKEDGRKEGEKYCPSCGETKPHSQFNRDLRQPDAYDSRCKECRKAERLDQKQRQGAA